MLAVRKPNLLVAPVALLALLMAAPLAHAATASDTTQFSVTAGTLAFGTAPDAPNLSALTINGQSQTLTAQMPNFSVVDGSGTASGWNVTVNGDSSAGKSAVFKQYCSNGASVCGTDAANSYVTGGQTLAANSLTLSSTGAAFTGQSGSTGTAPTHQCSTACNVDAGSAVKVASAAASAGMGTWQANSYGTSSLSLAAPSTLRALPANEIYRTDLVWTLNSGP